jgi:hypothetical protein
MFQVCGGHRGSFQRVCGCVAVELQGILKNTTSVAYIDHEPYAAIFIPGAAHCITPKHRAMGWIGTQ